ncbi:MAG: polyprenyl synthetase family protein [Microgenomates group bacterium]
MQVALRNFIQKYKERVDREIENELARRMDEVADLSPHLIPILTAMKELSVGGKRLRAMLTILGYELSGQEVNDEVIKAAAMMELFHLGLLIQDDFMDKDTLRRGVKTIIARYEDRHVGNFVSMLAGDYTFGWGIEIISGLNSPISNSQIINAMRVWGKYFTRVGYGQTLDGLEVADEKTILQILELKSGEYSCVLPLVLGATLGGADQKLITNLEKYGMELGWVFQLRDDWLGVWGITDQTGKPAGQDKKGKVTFATMYGKDATEAAIKEHMNLALEIVAGLQGQSSQADLMCMLVEWMGTREN